MRVLIADDDAIVAQSLATILGAEPDVAVVALEHSGPAAVTRYSELRPDIALLDIRMPDGDGLTAAEAILAADPDARVVFLTTFADDEYIVRALRLGASGYLIKQDITQIAPALRSVMAGLCVLEGRAVERGIITLKTAPSGRVPGFEALSEREYEVVEAVADGLDNAEIAERLFLSEGTVRNHVSAILAKLGLRNRTGLAVAYLRS